MSDFLSFPDGFLWGVAAASAQIEGAAFEDGKGESIWDRFSRKPDAVLNGDTLDNACDHYHRYQSDADLMAQLGWKHYRLSLAWPRIVPDGIGAVNERGLAFYDRLIDAFLSRGITPHVTLFHWDLPQKLEDEGGWLNRATVDAFAIYCDLATQRLGDRVKSWFTLNEMPCFIGLGYETGIHAPGRKESRKAVNQAYHHALLAHGVAVSSVKSNVQGGQVGLVHNAPSFIPFTETPADMAAASALFRAKNEQLLGPVFEGKYPDSWLETQGSDAPEVQDGDLGIIAQPGDFLGLNLYASTFVRAGKDGQPEALSFPRGFPKGDLPWINISPQTLYHAVRDATEQFGAGAIYITENGSAFDDQMTAQGEIIDLDRREYVRNYLLSLHRATKEGFDVRGYFAWSLMDNFEWAEGYEKRFGLIHVDYETQKRTPKLSAQWYSEVCRENRLV